MAINYSRYHQQLCNSSAVYFWDEPNNTTPEKECENRKNYYEIDKVHFNQCTTEYSAGRQEKNELLAEVQHHQFPYVKPCLSPPPLKSLFGSLYRLKRASYGSQLLYRHLRPDLELHLSTWHSEKDNKNEKIQSTTAYVDINPHISSQKHSVSSNGHSDLSYFIVDLKRHPTERQQT